MTREATNWLLEAIEDGMLDATEVVKACVSYMSEDDVADMCHANELGYPGNDNYSDADADDETDDETDD